MAEAQRAAASDPRIIIRFRDWFADHLGVDQERKTVLYTDLSSAATLRDATYWLQILFAAGIATLGLVLNSPAVIIGAMLISPLMGPILSGGLALAAGDFILGLRSIINLAFSCAIAVTLAVLLVALLPFKEMTNEIASRTHPTTLDLVVALFSGAVGSIATCKQVKGVVTSIPGVAIAVALMPPLCVAGYGMGYAFSVNGSEGMRVAGGGALLFLTNLVAITFTAMVVFLALHIDTESVRKRIEEWRTADPESAWFTSALKRVDVLNRFRGIGKLPVRLLMIGIPILIILFPLAQSFNQLKAEITKKQDENNVRRAAIALWQENFGKLPDGAQRSFMDQLVVAQQDGKLSLQFRVFTSKPLSAEERNEYKRLVAARLNKPPDAVTAQFVEIPTTSEDLVAKAREERRVDAPPSVAQLQANFVQALDAAFDGLTLPPPAELIDYQATTTSSEPIHISLNYLSERDIEPDATVLITNDIRNRLSYPTAQLTLTHIAASLGPIDFRRNQTGLIAPAARIVDRAAQVLQQHSALRVVIVAGRQSGEPEGISAERATAVRNYLVSEWQIQESRIEIESVAEPVRETRLVFKIGRND